jgi:pimeloyl-ACP methyl ester carboxylesterase
VLVLPGFAASDASTLALRSYLRWLGYDARGWGLGTNRGDLPALVPRVVRLLEGKAASARRRVRCVGWSLGGNLAREAARERPDLVERVVTLGTPAVGGPKYTSVAHRYRRQGVDLDEVEARVAERERVPIRVPVTAIYSRRDGVVAWRACIDRATPDVEHVEVSATHLGLGFHPEVYRVVADRLARARPSPASR